MTAPQLIVSGQSATFEVAVTVTPPTRRTVPGLRLRLLNPSGHERVIREGIKFADGVASVSIVLRDPGHWEYQWQGEDRVYEHGQVFVRKTGFVS